jgi:hypothetical protein
MKLHYDPETDSLYIEFNDAPGSETRIVADGVVADFGANGDIVGIDIEHASRRLDLTRIEAFALPVAAE